MHSNESGCGWAWTMLQNSLRRCLSVSSNSPPEGPVITRCTEPPFQMEPDIDLTSKTNQQNLDARSSLGSSPTSRGCERNVPRMRALSSRHTLQPHTQQHRLGASSPALSGEPYFVEAADADDGAQLEAGGGCR
mmetsp:Transcript_26217/g.75085  ORF Transcript_26217/g.75085 Transcript_26217/m.75085 type:complete len:134 (-) Transcript_26217:674-1075(-)